MTVAALETQPATREVIMLNIEQNTQSHDASALNVFERSQLSHEFRQNLAALVDDFSLTDMEIHDVDAFWVN